MLNNNLIREGVISLAKKLYIEHNSDTGMSAEGLESIFNISGIDEVFVKFAEAYQKPTELPKPSFKDLPAAEQLRYVEAVKIVLSGALDADDVEIVFDKAETMYETLNK